MNVICCTKCDEFGFSAGLPQKMFLNNEVGREGLWKEIQEGLKKGIFEAKCVDELRILVLAGNIVEARKRIRYASLTVIPVIG